jgi:hypothetical protein
MRPPLVVGVTSHNTAHRVYRSVGLGRSLRRVSCASDADDWGDSHIKIPDQVWNDKIDAADTPHLMGVLPWDSASTAESYKKTIYKNKVKQK